MRIYKTKLAALISVTFLTSVVAWAEQGASEFSSVNVPPTIQVVVASSAGGSSDATARVTMEYWQKAIEQLSGKDVSTVIKNLPGAGTEIGATAVAEGDNDGSTIGLINLPHIPLIEATRDPSFSPWLENFTALGMNVFDPNVMILGERSQYDSIKQALKSSSEGGDAVIVGAQGPLSDDQLALYAFEDATGANFSFIPFSGGADANRALRNGEIDITIGNVYDYIQLEDEAKDAFIYSAQRSDLIPDVKTAEEMFNKKIGEYGSTRGFAAPEGLPEDVANLYRAAFEKTFNNEEYLKQMKQRNIPTVKPLIGEEFQRFLEENDKNVVKLVPYFEESGS